MSNNYKTLFIGLLVLLFVGGGYYFITIQNSGQLPGGNIALVKLLWLGLIIFFWFLSPILLLINGTKNHKEKLIIIVHLCNVWGRGIIELYMIYVSYSWQHAYGIGHDFISIFLLLSLLMLYSIKLSKMIKNYLFILSFTFFIEAIFALYMHSNVSNETGLVYFVPDSVEFSSILYATWIAVIALSLYMVVFIKKWIKNHA
jgi:hypothetical protein